jgi:DNA mismatch repair protein MutS2
MNDHALRLLEFDTIRKELLAYAWSEDGKKLLRRECFMCTPAELEKIRRPVAEFRRLFNGKDECPPLSLPDITEFVRLAEKPGAVLEAAELGTIGRYLGQAKTLKNYLAKGETLLREEAEGLPDISGLRSKIEKIIDGEGNIRDNDIPSLAELRRSIRSCRRDLDALAASYLGNPKLQGYWQSDRASLKDGRVALPLGSNFRGRIKGVVHEISRGGATAFFEPLDIFEKNNQLAETENAYHRELFRILKDLTAETGASAGDILYLTERIARVDSWQIRARYGHIHSCFPAGIADSGIVLCGARHPLLGEKAVPIDISLKEGIRLLLVTGPNTGGKTVALKTAGLLALMNQFGLDIPAAQDSVLPLFDDIFVDIGDEQSITESLSTFSAHAGNLAKILGACTAKSLVLLDELGSGTDPEQGAAIAMAFLDRFSGKGVHGLLTTHLGTLKHYAFSREGISNASVQFDPEELKPAYRIIPGVPGESHALEIARRCGVPSEIIRDARNYIGRDETDSARLIRSLAEKDRELTAALRDQGKLLRELEEERRRLAQKERDILGREIRLRKEGLQEVRRFLDESRKELEALVRDIRRSGQENARDALTGEIQKIRAFTGGIKQHIDGEERRIEEIKPLIRVHYSGPWKEGMEVLLGDPPRRAVLERKLKNGRWLVAAGAVRISVPENELAPAAPTGKEPEIFIAFAETGGQEPAQFELDIRGRRAEDALNALIKQTDRAIIQGLREFSVIHGKGEGILQTTVRDYLRSHPAVESFSFALPEQGGAGKTFVKLKG